MRRAEAHYEAMIGTSFAGAPDPVPVPPLVIKGIVAGLHRVARAQLLAGREHELPGLADELLEWMLCFRCRAATSIAQLDAPPAPVALAPPTPGAALPFTLTIATCAARSACASSKRSRGSRPKKATVSCGSRGSAPPRASRASASTSTSRTSRAAHRGARTPRRARARPRRPGRRRRPDLARRPAPRAVLAMCGHRGHPVLARLGFIEVFAPGPDGMLCRERVIAGVAESFRASAPAGQRPSELAAEASVGAVWGVVHNHIALGRAHQLPRITGVLSYLALAPAIGAEVAVRAIVAAGGDARRCGPRVRRERWMSGWPTGGPAGRPVVRKHLA